MIKRKKSPRPPLSRGRSKPELLAPAGNLEKMKVALTFGADAVYAGIPDFSLRVRINDFNIKTLGEAVRYAHKLKKKVYVTVNIFAHNKHLKKLPAHVKALKKIGPDGIFISDPGVMEAIRKVWPKANIILSTQANCTNWQAVKFWGDQGMKRVILGREVPIGEIREMKKHVSKVELETFVHGALCMAYSGRCFLSKYLADRSANLGDCAQPCRWKYNINQFSSVILAEAGIQARCTKVDPRIREDDENKSVIINPIGRGENIELVEEEHGSYILNSEDLCLIKRVPEMIEAGISAFKIEGRAKSVYYLATVVGAYRKAIDLSCKNFYPVIPGRSGAKGKGIQAGGTKVDPHIREDDELKKDLKKLYRELEEKLTHRGYTEGFMFGKGKTAQNLDNSHKISAWEFCGQVVKPHPSPLLTKERGISVYVKVHNSLYVGDQIEIVPPGYDIIKMKVKKMTNLKGEDVSEAHGGQKTVVILEVKKDMPEFSVIRRKLK